ncbi:MAG: hypothetical protein ABI183_10560, partial [Polyangiaceae bacterium]
MKSRDLIAAIEACYRVESDFRTWLSGVHDAVGALLDHGMGTLTYRYDLLSPCMTVHETLQNNAPMDVEGVQREISRIPSAILRDVWRAVPCGSSGEIEQFESHDSAEKQGFAAIFDRYYTPVGVRDS